MRISLNLATRPFLELRPFFLRLRLLMAGLVLLGVALAVGAHLLSARAEVQQIELDRLRHVTIATQDVRISTEQRMRQPANAAVLDRAHFLNALFLRKSFSWTAVMMDLEDVLPVGVQVTSIEPAVTADGAVLIRLRVAGERDRAVQLVRNLERSQRFLQPRLGSEAAQARETGGGNAGVNGAGGLSGTPALAGAPAAPPGVEFEILANYNPLPAGESYRVGHVRAAAPVSSPPEPLASPAIAAAPAPQPVAKPSPAPPAPVRNAVPGNFQNPNSRSDYPRNGVVLPPYSGGPPRPQDGRVPRPTPPDAPGGGPL